MPSNEVAEKKLDKACYQQLDLAAIRVEERFAVAVGASLKAAKEDGLQMNHQMTPDAIGLLVAYDRPNDEERQNRLPNCRLCCRKRELVARSVFLQSASGSCGATAIDVIRRCWCPFSPQAFALVINWM